VIAGVGAVWLFQITESQSGWVWKGPLWVTQSNSLWKQGHPEEAAQDRVHVGLEYLQRRRLRSLFQGSVTLRGKKFFHIFSWNFLCFSLCPLPLVLSLGTTGKSLAPSS